METGTVSYICTATEHLPRAAPNGTGLTVHRGKWAFCPAGAPAGHVWSPVKDASLDELTRAATSAARAGELAEG